MLRFRRASSFFLAIGLLILLSACGQPTEFNSFGETLTTQGSARISGASFRRGSLVATGMVVDLQLDTGEQPIVTVKLIARGSEVLCQNKGGNFPPGQNQDRAMEVMSMGTAIYDFSGSSVPTSFPFEVVAPDPLDAAAAGCPNGNWTAVTVWTEAEIIVTTADQNGDPVTLAQANFNLDCDPGGGECETEDVTPAPTCLGEPATVYVDEAGMIVGGENDEQPYTAGFSVLTGSEGPDVILGTDDDDFIDALAGDDLVCGGPGDDDIYGGPDNDLLLGEAGNDYLDGDGTYVEGEGFAEEGYEGEGYEGEGFEDQLFGGAGDDDIFDYDGNMGAFGGTGNDDIYVRLGYGWGYPDEGEETFYPEVLSYVGMLAGGYGDDDVTLINDTGFELFIDVTGDERDEGTAPGEGSEDVLTLLPDDGEGECDLEIGCEEDSYYEEGWSSYACDSVIIKFEEIVNDPRPCGDNPD